MAKKEAAAMAACEVEALTDYIDEFGRANGGADGLLVDLKSIITEKVRLPGGKVQVLISVISRQPWECETYFFILQISGRKVLRRRLNSEPQS
jgi:hypothetical protein